jgi:hypothetical protein
MTTIQKCLDQCNCLIHNPFTAETLTVILSVIFWVIFIQINQDFLVSFLYQILKPLRNYFLGRPEFDDDDNRFDIEDLDQDVLRARFLQQEEEREPPIYVKYAAIHIILDYYEETEKPGKLSKKDLYALSPKDLRCEYQKITGLKL